MQAYHEKILNFLPQLVIEILSEATHLKDGNVKYPKYEAEGIPYYIMVDVDKKEVEIYGLVEGRYQRKPLDESKSFEFIVGDCRFEMLFDLIWE